MVFGYHCGGDSEYHFWLLEASFGEQQIDFRLENKN